MEDITLSGGLLIIAAILLSILFVWTVIKYGRQTMISSEYRARIRSLTQLHTLRTMEIDRTRQGQLTLTQVRLQAGQNSEAKGFNKPPLPWAQKLMLIVSELAESMEADRAGKSSEKFIVEENCTQFEYFEKRVLAGNSDFRKAFEIYVKDHREAELADAIIRLCELAHEHNIDIEKYVRYGLLYNLDRPAMHGKKY